MEQQITLIKRIGNFFATLILGDTRETIIRTDERVKSLKETMDNRIGPDLKDVRERFAVVEDKVKQLIEGKYSLAHSPRQLNQQGEKILQTSGIKEIIEERKNDLLKLVKEKKASNAYDAEVVVLSIVQELPKHYPNIIDKLKDGAFKSGVEMDGLLFVGGIYLRNLIFAELGFPLTDLDKPKQSN